MMMPVLQNKCVQPERAVIVSHATIMTVHAHDDRHCIRKLQIVERHSKEICGRSVNCESPIATLFMQ